MVGELKLLAYLMGTFAVLCWGIGLVSDAFYVLSSEFFRNLVNVSKRKKINAVISGFSASVMFQNIDHLSRILTSYVSIRLVDAVLGNFVMLGTLLGHAVTILLLSIDTDFFPQIMLAGGMFFSYWFSESFPKNVARVVMGYGIVLWSIQLFSGVILPIGPNLEFFSVIKNDYNFFFISFYVFLGTIITVLFQRPVLILLLSIIMGKSGFVDMATAICLVVGANLGVSIYSVIHYFQSRSKIRVISYAHFIFNSLSAIICVLFLKEMVDVLEGNLPPLDTLNDFYKAFGFKLFIGYLMINTLSILFSLIFLKPLAILIRKNIYYSEDNKLDDVNPPGIDMELLPSCGLVLVYKEMKKFATSVDGMFDQCRRYLFDEKKPSGKTLNQIKQIEKDADVIQNQLTFHICKIMEKKLTVGQSFEAQGFSRIIDELESITDYLEKVAVFNTRLLAEGADTGLIRKEFVEYYDRVWDFYKLMLNSFERQMIMDLSKFTGISEELKNISQEVREKYLDELSKTKVISPSTVLIYSDMVVSLRKIRGHIFNIAQTLCRVNMAIDN